MGHVPYVGWATRSRATAMTRFIFLYKKKKTGRHNRSNVWVKDMQLKFEFYLKRKTKKKALEFNLSVHKYNIIV